MQGLFSGREAHCFSVDEVVSAAGLSKTTARRYLEHGVETGFLEVEMLYGKLAIRGGCIAALRSKLKPLAGREGLETSEAALLFDQLPAFWISGPSVWPSPSSPAADLSLPACPDDVRSSACDRRASPSPHRRSVLLPAHCRHLRGSAHAAPAASRRCRHADHKSAAANRRQTGAALHHPQELIELGAGDAELVGNDEQHFPFVRCSSPSANAACS